MEKRRLNVLLPDKMIDQLDAVAEEMGLNRTSMLTVIVKQYLDTQRALTFSDNFKNLQAMMEQGLKGQVKVEDLGFGYTVNKEE